MPAPIMRHRAKTILGQKQHLSVPCIGIERPAVRKRDDRTFAPVFVVDCRAIFYRNCAHMNFLLMLVRAEHSQFLGSCTVLLERLRPKLLCYQESVFPNPATPPVLDCTNFKRRVRYYPD